MTLSRNVLLMIFLSFIAVFWSSASSHLIGIIQSAFDTASDWLSMDIGGHVLGVTTRHWLALVSIPLFFGVLTYAFYWVFKKESTAVLTWVVWGVWLVLTTVMLATR